MNDKQLQKCLDDKMSFSQIAAMFGTTLGTIAGKVRRLKKRFAISKPKPMSKKILTFNTEARTTTAVVSRYVQRPPKAVELTKNELREMLRQALVNTSLM